MISDRSIRRVVEQLRMPPAGDASSERGQIMQVILDASASMTSGDGSKEQRSRELAITLLRLGVKSGSHCTLWAARGSDRDRVLQAAQVDRLVHLPFDGTVNLAEAWPAPLPAPAGLRIVISDYLFPGDPASLVRRASAGVDKLCFVQMLDPWEAAPAPQGTLTLVDAVSGDSIEMELDAATIERYGTRLAALQDGYAQACTAAGAVWISISAAADLHEICSRFVLHELMLHDA